MGTSRNRDCQWASMSVLKDFTPEALTISADSLFQNGTARFVDAAHNIYVGGTSRRGRVAACGLDV